MHTGDPKTWPHGRRLLGLLLALGLSLPVACTAEGPLAQVVFVQGEVNRSRAGGPRTPLKVETTLDARDVLFTGYESFAILHLKNDHLVRIDEDLKLAVKKIALLRADPASAEADQQLAALLYPEEQSILGEVLQGTERTAGWHSRVMAVESVPAEAREPHKAASDFAMKREAEAAPVAKSAPAPATRGFAAAPGSDALLGEIAPEGGAAQLEEAAPVPAAEPPPPDDDARRRVARAPQPPPPPPAPAPAPPAESLSLDRVADSVVAPSKKAKSRRRSAASRPLTPRQLRQHPELLQCLFAKLPAAQSKLLLQLKVKNGAIHRLRLGDARPVPACARNLLLGKAWGGATKPGWISLRLRRP